MTGLFVIVVLVIVILIAIVSAYNKFVQLKNQAEEATAQVDAHLKQRFDLVPNLVETVKGYAKHESKTLKEVIAARNAALKATSIEEKDQANKALSGSLTNLFALSESYPELKSNTNFVSLQKELSSIEKEILQARKYYNAVVKTFNTTIETFPNSLIAKLFGAKFTKMAYLEVSDEEKKNVKVSF